MAHPQKSEALLAILSRQPVIPVVAVSSAGEAVRLARALAAGGLPAIEITLRTPAALEAIRAVADEVPEAAAGAGTILNPAQFEAAEKAGATFIVSPGTTPSLVRAAADSAVPLLPGAASASELMAALELGYSVLKFFPAEQAGGAPFLKSIAPVMPQVRFCPTGGVSPANVGDYLKLPNVVCVGGSWVAPAAALASGDFAAVTALAREAAALKG